jgi:hypothetical protein
MTVDVAVLLWGVLVCAFVLIGFVTGEWGAVRRDLQRRRPAAPADDAAPSPRDSTPSR